ncbi:MAG TPA: DNA cytosine methyltransferase [Candidatus Angelobacter sp.]
MGTRRAPARAKNKKQKYFIDVFAGCGGLSLGLLNAGWQGVFAVEKNRDAFNTFAANLIHNRRFFDWPKWLPQKPHTTHRLLSKHGNELHGLRGKIDLLAGGPPCQGFSLAGRRIHSDPRNSLIKQYLQIVNKVQPRFLLFENVQGFHYPFRKNGHGKEKTTPYSELIADELESAGYKVFSDLVDFNFFGVPQSRRRFILIGVKKGDPALKKLEHKDPFRLLAEQRAGFLRSKRLRSGRPIAAKEAIFDLETKGKSLIQSTESTIKAFKQISYKKVSFPSRFLSLMRRNAPVNLDGLRLARHSDSTVKYFKKIMTTCQLGKSLNDHDRERLDTKKQALTPLDPEAPAATVTTLPDDMIHYSEPRILTVRENARLQTFPDWFKFTGPYTTGGKKRRLDCPRYTQVGNAVPPLFSEAIGRVLKSLVRKRAGPKK